MSLSFAPSRNRGRTSAGLATRNTALQTSPPRRDGLQQLAIAGLLISLAVLVPWLILYPAFLWADAAAARWCLAQWRPTA